MMKTAHENAYACEKLPYLQNTCEHVPLKACDSCLPQPKQLRFRLKASKVPAIDSSFNQSILPCRFASKLTPLSRMKNNIRLQRPPQLDLALNSPNSQPIFSKTCQRPLKSGSTRDCTLFSPNILRLQQSMTTSIQFSFH